jgi:hypothetical protein
MYWYFIQQTKKGSPSKIFKQSLLGQLAHLNAISKCSMRGISFPFWAAIWKGPLVAWLMTQIRWLLQEPPSSTNIHYFMHPMWDGSNTCTSQMKQQHISFTPSSHDLSTKGVWHTIVLRKFEVYFKNIRIYIFENWMYLKYWEI